MSTVKNYQRGGVCYHFPIKPRTTPPIGTRSNDFSTDERDYSIAAHMLESLRVKSVRLITNNPRKINALKALGINVTGRIPIVIPPNEYNRFYLETKALKSGHLIDFRGKARLQEQTDHLIVEGMSEEQIADMVEK